MIRIRASACAFCVVLTIIVIQGCISEPDLENYPTVSYANEVAPIIAGNCAQDGCHGYVDTEECSLVTYTDVRAKVTAGNARKSTIYRMITGRTSEFMPPSPANPLTEDQIRSIFVWIEQGAQDN